MADTVDAPTLVLRTEYRGALEDTRAEHRAFAQEKDLPKLQPVQRELVPWLTGAVEYAERYGSLAQEAARWRVAAGGLLVGLVVAVGALAHVATSSKVVPYVVQVDEHGYAVAIRPADKASASDERVLIASVARWVRALRSRVPDAVAQQAFVDEAFAMLSPRTAAVLKAKEAYEQNPHRADLRVDVELSRVQPMSDKTFTVEWTERTRSGAGAMTWGRFSAVVTVAISPTRTLRDVVANPLGVFVTEYSISQLQ